MKDVKKHNKAENARIQEGELLRTLLDHLPDAIYFKDLESRFMRINNALAKALGLSDPARAVGKMDFDFFTDEHARQALADEEEIIRTGRPMMGKEEKETWPDGHVSWVSTTKMPLWDAHENIVGTFGVSRDITGRKQAEQALLASEEKFAKAFRSSPNAMTISTLEEGRFLEVNDAFVHMFECQREYAVGRTSRELGFWVNPEDRVRIVDKLREGDLVRGSEVRMRTGSGQIIVCLFSAEAIEVGGVRCHFSVIQDITERKAAETALEATSRRLAGAMDLAQAAEWESDLATGMFTFNDRFYALYGTTSEREGGYQMPAETYLREFIPPEDVRAAREEIARVQTSTNPHASWQMEHRIRRRDGEIRHVAVRVSPIKDSEGRTVKLWGVNQDITQRKHAEEALRQTAQELGTLVQAAPLAIVSTDPKMHVLTWNDAAEHLFGWSESEVLGGVLPIIPDDQQEEFLARYDALLRGQGQAILESRRLRKDSTLVDVRISTAVIRSASGEPTAVIEIFTDLTESKALEEQLRLAQRMESVGRLAGGVAHDFNNLLTVIAGYSQLAKRGLNEGSPLHGHLDEVLKASDRAASLTQQLLAYGRKQVLQVQVLDLNTVLLDLEKMLRRLIGEDIELRTVPQPDLGRVKADLGYIGQVVMNLVVNARDAMAKGGTITIETANAELTPDYAHSHFPVIPGRYVMIAVSDTGTGITPEIQAHIFEPFFTTKEQGKGTGLGLATVYGIVKQSGGYIWVYSELGRGSTFKVYLPRVEEPLGGTKSATASIDLVKGLETVLVVEDEDAVRSFVRMTLESYGYNVLEAQGPDHALRIFEEYTQPIHLLLADVVMPRMGGEELAKRLSAAHPNLKVLYMSGYTDDAIVSHGILEPGVFFLQKPFAPKTLVKKVREILDVQT